jgi:HEAT repeat protein
MTNTREEEDVRQWLAVAPFDDPVANAALPNFSYEAWIDDGRQLPRVVDLLVELLEREIEQPSSFGERIAFALGWMDDDRAIPALTSAIEGVDPNLRIEAVGALGRLKSQSSFPLLARLLRDDNEDPNVRANAAIAIGHLGIPGSESTLKEATRSPDEFIAASAKEGLRLLGK